MMYTTGCPVNTKEVSMKATRKEIELIRGNTPQNLRGKEITSFPEGIELGYYMPSTANWRYQIWMILLDGTMSEVVVRFGHII